MKRIGRRIGMALAAVAILATLWFVGHAQSGGGPEPVPGQNAQPAPTTTTSTWSFHPTVTAHPPCGATPWDGGCG